MNKNAKGVCFLDIETVPSTKNYWEMDRAILEWFFKKHIQEKIPNYPLELVPELLKNTQEPEKLVLQKIWEEKAGLYPETGKVVCISVGVMEEEGDRGNYRTGSFIGYDEKKVLVDFANAANSRFSTGTWNSFSAFNGKEFDYPFLIKRMVYNQVRIPSPLMIQGKKPWEVTHLQDPCEVWKFTSYKGYVSLRVMAVSMGFDDPKNNMDGSQVGTLYYDTENREENLNKIQHYCEGDVITLAKCHVFITEYIF